MQKIVVPFVALLIMMPLAGTPDAQRRGAGGGAVTLAVAVSDSTGAPVTDVKVIVTGAAERSGRTEAGRLVFENLPPGAYRFRFEKDGFVTLEREGAGRGRAPLEVKGPPVSPVLPP